MGNEPQFFVRPHNQRELYGKVEVTAAKLLSRQRSQKIWVTVEPRLPYGFQTRQWLLTLGRSDHLLAAM